MGAELDREVRVCRALIIWLVLLVCRLVLVNSGLLHWDFLHGTVVLWRQIHLILVLWLLPSAFRWDLPQRKKHYCVELCCNMFSYILYTFFLSLQTCPKVPCSFLCCPPNTQWQASTDIITVICINTGQTSSLQNIWEWCGVRSYLPVVFQVSCGSVKIWITFYTKRKERNTADCGS